MSSRANGQAMQADELVAGAGASGIPAAIAAARAGARILLLEEDRGTHLAASACRLQPIVASVGQAAGTAAATAVRSGGLLSGVDLRALQRSPRVVV